MAAPTADDALNYAKRWVGNAPIDDANLKLRLLNDATCMLWMAAPWQWTVNAVEETTVTNAQQDISLAGAYADLLNLIHMHWTDGQVKKDLQVASTLPSTASLNGTVSQVAYIAGSPNKLRLYPVPAGYGSGTKIVGYYKKIAPVIDVSNEGNSYSTVTGGHDEWFWVFQEIVLLKAYRFIKDPREGAVQVGPQGTAYTGQNAVVQAAISSMMAGEEKFYKTLGEVVGNG
jgi:hypothetical protein